MEGEEVITPAFKNAVNFFNSLNKNENARSKISTRKPQRSQTETKFRNVVELKNDLNTIDKPKAQSFNVKPAVHPKPIHSKINLITKPIGPNHIQSKINVTTGRQLEVSNVKPDLVSQLIDNDKKSKNFAQDYPSFKVQSVQITSSFIVKNNLASDRQKEISSEEIETCDNLFRNEFGKIRPKFASDFVEAVNHSSVLQVRTNTTEPVATVESDKPKLPVKPRLKPQSHDLVPKVDEVLNLKTCETSALLVKENEKSFDLDSKQQIVVEAALVEAYSNPKDCRTAEDAAKSDDLHIFAKPNVFRVRRGERGKCRKHVRKGSVGAGGSSGSGGNLIEPYGTFVIKCDSFEGGVMVSDANSPVITRKLSKRGGIYKKIRINIGQGDENDRSDAFLEPYLQGLGDRQSPGVGAPSPSPPPACRIAPFLLPTPASRSPSRESLISSNGGSDAGSEDSGDTGYGAACDIGLVERLIRSHPIWFLPGIQRAGAFHLLQGKEEGCFVVRQSSQPDTMALSVRLPPDKGPYIEHYLIQSSNGRLGLETSENRFDNMPALIAHYANCCDELPVQLTLPKAIREARSRQQLSSLALLGQEFWRYSPPPSASSSPDADLVLNLNPLMSTFKTAEPSTPVTKESVARPARPNTLNLINNLEPIKAEPLKCIPSFKNEQVTKTPPPPPPRWSKPTTPQNNFTVTTTVTFSVNSQSPRNEQPTSHMDIICDPKRMSPEGQTSTMSSKGSLRRGPEQITSPNGSVLSPNSDPSSIMSPDTLSPLSVTKTTRHSRRTKPKISKHYQESDILESPTVYYRSAVGDKISDYEDLWTNEQTSQKTKNSFTSPDLLQHTGTVVSLNNNVLSPTDSQTGSQHSHCSTPIGNQNSAQSPAAESSTNTSPQDAASSPKQSSPFYAEPADSLAQTAVPRRLFNRNLVPMQQRHSNPAVLHSHSPLSPGIERVESSDFNGTISYSVDNLSPKQRITGIKKPEVKPVLPPSVKPRINDTWQVDNSWKFLGNEGDMSVESSDPDYDSDWPATIPNFHISQFAPDPDERISIQEMISRRAIIKDDKQIQNNKIGSANDSTDHSHKAESHVTNINRQPYGFPDIRMSADTTDDELCRMSAYDNVDDRRVPRAPPSEISELTEFSDPWAEITHAVSNTEAEDSSFSENCNQPPKVASINRSKSFKDRLDPLLSAPRLKALRSRDQGDSRAVGAAIRNYALDLAKDKTTTFAQNIDNFIACTCESREVNPQVVMRNMRQFMSGMKNYLVKHGEKGFDKEVERERSKLKSTEFLNLDAILEGVLHCLVVTPLKNHLHKLFVDRYTKTGAIRLLADNIQYASTRPISELAIKPKITLPSETALQTISQYLTRLQAADSPLEKLEYLLAAIATIFNSVKMNQLSGSGRNVTLGADDFLPLFVWVLVKTNFVAAEIEAEYMWGLLHPSLLSGEGGYYLTTLSSAVHVLKNFKESNEENVKNNLKSDSVLKVVVPDELHGSILTKTLPARPHMTTKEVCKIIAHKARITNPQDFALYRLVDGEETMLGDNECPQDLMSEEGKHVMLAYKRIDAKIAWPKQQQSN